MKKTKLKKSAIIVLTLVCLIVIGLIIFLSWNSEISAGKIVDGKVVYSDKIETASEASTKVIEINSINKKVLDTVIITPERLDAIKNKDKLYSMQLKDYIKRSETPNRDIYNINKAIELKIVKEDDPFIKFLYKVTGFKNEKQFIKFCEDAFKLMDH